MRTRAVVCSALATALCLAPAAARGQVTGAPPVIEKLTGPGGAVLTSSVATITVAATDPGGGELAYAWTATGGAITGAGAEATWTAPALAGTYTIRVTATNAFGSATSSLAIPVILAGYRGGLAATLTAPRRLAMDELGNLFVVDAREGALVLLTPRGDVKGRALLGEPAAAVASAPGTLYVATSTGKVLTVDPLAGARTGELALDGGPLRGPAGMAYEASRGLVWIAERAASRVRAIRPDGTTAFVLAAARGAPLTSPVDVAVDAAGGKVWVLLEEAPGSATTAAPELGRVAHAFTPDGAWLAYSVPGGTATTSIPGRVARAGGLAVDAAGLLHVTDVFQGQVLVFTATGTFRGHIGGYGTDPGRLRNPLGATFMKNGDLAVANVGSSRIERFGGSAELPTCAGDLDCDGLPDDFEASGGLNPGSAADALADTDGDGLTNLEELARGTNPSLRDTDGDGWSDSEELLAGYDPLNPSDRRPWVGGTPVVYTPVDPPPPPPPAPEVVASGPASSAPGLVRLSATVVNGDGTCALAWTQRSGPDTVPLRGAASATPTFVARAAGRYAFEARATCGGSATDPALVETEILDVSPLADAGSLRVVEPSTPLVLDAGGSSDANADVLSFSWNQMLGAPVTGETRAPLLPLEIGDPGYYVFSATAQDRAGNTASADAPVLVVLGPTSTAIIGTPVRGAVGEAIVLDASSSYVASANAAFQWAQVDGPTVALDTSAGSVARFTPAAPGRHVFEVWITDQRRRSPPARVDVFVANAAGAMPTAAVTPVASAEVGAPISLDGSASASASGAPLSYAWRQVGGPAAGLTAGDRAIATVVPFAPGSHEFELVVRDGPVEAVPARVRFDATKPGVRLPVAVATGPGAANRGWGVVLDGTRSTGTDLRYAWTQLAGPWTALDDPSAPAPSFHPIAPGVYTFELVVESGGVRSGPALVTVLVLDGQGTAP